MAALWLACPMRCGLTVRFTDAGFWTGPDGTEREFVHGRCRQCGADVLIAPRSDTEVEAASPRLARAG